LLLIGSSGFVDVGRPLCHEYWSVVYNCWWPSPEQPFWVPWELRIFETSLFVASYDSQDYCAGIRTRLHTREHWFSNQVKVKVTLRLTVSQSVLVSSPIWGLWPDIHYSLTVTVLLFWGAGFCSKLKTQGLSTYSIIIIIQYLHFPTYCAILRLLSSCSPAYAGILRLTTLWYWPIRSGSA
jgi:hypothetical protein